MVRTLAVVVAFVAVVLLLVPQGPPIEQPGVPAAQVQAAAERDAERLSFAPVAVEVAEGWQADYVRTERRVDDVLQWRLGLRSPTGSRVDVEQAAEATDRWLLRTDDGEPGEVVPTQVAGADWDRFMRGDGTTAYASVREGVTTVVSAGKDSPELEAAVAAVSRQLPG